MGRQSTLDYQAFLRTLRRYATLGMLSLAILSICGAFVTFGGLLRSSIMGTDQPDPRRLVMTESEKKNYTYRIHKYIRDTDSLDSGEITLPADGTPWYHHEKLTQQIKS